MPTRVNKTEQIEKALAKVYISLFKQIKKEPLWPYNVPMIQAQPTFSRKVYEATRKAIEDVYKEGTAYVGTKLKTDVFFTTIDVMNIQEATNAGVKSFWQKIQDDANRTLEVQMAEVIPLLQPAKEPFATIASLTGISTVLAVSTLAVATKSKTQQIATTIAPMTITDPESLNLDIQPGEEKPRIRWITQHDEKVCPICNNLDGQEWEYDDPSIPVPSRNGPNGTHSNCRCYLELF